MSLESVRSRGAVIATALLLTTGCIRATAQAPVQTGSPGPALADSLARAFLAEHDPAGLVVALVTPAGDHILPYGAVSLEDGAPPVGATTRFEIGSVTKVFTTTLLAEMVARGELELVRMTREHRHPIARSVSVALGWHVTVLDGVEAFWHNGATGGFRSFVAFVPDRMTGVVVLTNSAVPIPAVDQLALRIL